MTTKVLIITIQCGGLIIFKNFYMYLFIQIIGTILENLYISNYVDNKYKLLKNNNKFDFDREEKNKVFKIIKPIMIQNLSAFLVSSTDNIIISKFLNVYSECIYTNYVLITSIITTLFSHIFSTFTISFGNLYVSEGKSKHIGVSIK